jgi:hypothetical protein
MADHRLLTDRFLKALAPAPSGELYGVTTKISAIPIRRSLPGRHQDTGAVLHSNGLVPDEIEIIHNRANSLGQ